jgi:hypothetical protein
VARVEGAWKSEGRNSRNAKGPGPVKNWYGGGPEKACDVLLYIRRIFSAVGEDCKFTSLKAIALSNSSKRPHIQTHTHAQTSTHAERERERNVIGTKNLVNWLPKCGIAFQRNVALYPNRFGLLYSLFQTKLV